LLSHEVLLLVLFNILILGLLALDLFVFHKDPHRVTTKEAAFFSAVWITLSLIFNAGIFLFMGPRAGMEFFTGYVIEKALSVDNIFVFLVIFSYFGVPSAYQHRVLFWGVVGALIMRSLFILIGTALISRFEWVLYVFGVILLYSGWKLLKAEEIEVHPEKNVIIRATKKLFPHVTTGYDPPTFFTRRGGVVFITPLLLVLLTIETSDIMFAVDSIPAVFGVTRDPFIVYSSNVFAILGLRALYFLLAGAMTRLYYLSSGLALVLIVIGIKMLLEPFVHVPIGWSLAVVVGIIGVAVVASMIKKRTGHV
jgi:tellurite resistance protein TerC